MENGKITFSFKAELFLELSVPWPLHFEIHFAGPE